MMVIEKPIQFTIVSAVPLDSCGAFCATNVENMGESAITTRPQNNRNETSAGVDPVNRKKGETRQQAQDKNNETVASFFAPKCCDSRPLRTHANPPEAIIRKDKKGTSMSIPLCCLFVNSITGTNAQKVYSSHICPKYPKADCLHFLELKISLNAFH